MEYLVGIIGALLGYLFYTNTKRKSAEALLENNEVNKQSNQIDKEMSKTQGIEQSEEEKRKALEVIKNDAETKSTTDYFNDRK